MALHNPSDDAVSYFASTLASIMRERSLTQMQVAQSASISQSQISQYLRDEARPDTEGLQRLCTALDPATALLVAFLKDEVPPDLRGSVLVEPAEGLRIEESPALPSIFARSPAHVRDLLHSLARECEQNPKLVAALESILQLCGR